METIEKKTKKGAVRAYFLVLSTTNKMGYAPRAFEDWYRLYRRARSRGGGSTQRTTSARKSPAFFDEDRAVSHPASKPKIRELTAEQKRAVEDSFDFYPLPLMKNVTKQCGASEQVCASYATKNARVRLRRQERPRRRA